MKPETLTERERQTLDHLKQAQELGSTLADYATAFNLNVDHLYSGKRQLQQKGFWPTKAVEPEKAQLLAVQVVPQTTASDALVCRLTAPGGWSIQCSRWPEASWLTALMNPRGRASS